MGTTVKLKLVEFKNGIRLVMVLPASSKRRREFANENRQVDILVLAE